MRNTAQNLKIKTTGTSEPKKIGFFLVPGFALLSFASAIEPLRAANRLSGRELYAWRYIANEREVASSCGIKINADHLIGEDFDLDFLFVVAGGNPFEFDHSSTFSWLRGQAKNGVNIGGISGGPVLLAKANLLDGYRCTVHWEHLPPFQELYPNLDVTTNLYEIDGARLTCSGATAALDMMHEVISSEHGTHLGAAVSDWFLQTKIRESAEQQRLSLGARLGINHPKLLKVLEIMERELEEPKSREDLAREVGLSVRQIERLCRVHLHTSLTAHYKKVRLVRARNLLRQTSLPVTEIGVACGFSSASHFSQSYNSQFGYAPRFERRSPTSAHAGRLRQ